MKKVYKWNGLYFQLIVLFFTSLMIDCRFRDDKPIGDLIKKENLEEVINATAAVLKIKDSSTKEAGKYTCVVKKAAENETVIGEIEVSSTHNLNVHDLIYYIWLHFR